MQASNAYRRVPTKPTPPAKPQVKFEDRLPKEPSPAATLAVRIRDLAQQVEEHHRRGDTQAANTLRGQIRTLKAELDSLRPQREMTEAELEAATRPRPRVLETTADVNPPQSPPEVSPGRRNRRGG